MVIACNNQDAIAKRNPQYQQKSGDRNFGLRKQEAGIAQNNIEAQRRFDRAKLEAEQGWAGDPTDGKAYKKYAFPEYGPPAPPVTETTSTIDSLSDFLQGVRNQLSSFNLGQTAAAALAPNLQAAQAHFNSLSPTDKQKNRASFEEFMRQNSSQPSADQARAELARRRAASLR